MAAERASWESLQETRIALAFYGGVALAVYESGVAMEFFRLVKGEGPYQALRPLIGKVEVDIITGSSAGGLNGAFLANALVNRGDMHKLLEVWREEGDLDKLLYGPTQKRPRSLLDGDRFRQKIYEALLEKRSGPANEGALQPYLDLFITATNLDGDCVKIKQAEGEPAKAQGQEEPHGDEIRTRTHRQVFHFAYREEGRTGEPARNDFKDDADAGLLAEAVRTTSSFPFAFEPVLVTQEGLGRYACDLSAPAYHVDGGVLDNKPIEHAVQAIGARRADKQVNRLLFYIEPDPERIVPRLAQTEARCYTPWEVIFKALITLPGYQSITSALRKIQQHNRMAEARKRTLGYYDAAAGRFRAGKKGSIAEDSWSDDQHRRLPFLLDTDRATALYRALEDGYMDLRLDNDVTTDTDNKGALQQALHDLTKLLGNQARGPFYDLKRILLDRLDLAYHQRMYRYLAQIIRDLYPPAPDGTGTGAGDDDWRRAVTRLLNGLKDFFYRQEEALRDQRRREAALQETELAKLIMHMQHVVQELRADQRVHADQAEAKLGALLKLIEPCELLRSRKASLDERRATAWHRLQNDYLELPAAVLNKCDDEYNVQAGYWKLRDALDSFLLRDLILYPMMQSPEVAAELQPVKFARISPEDAGQYLDKPRVQEKLAGEQCGHFGGFMSETWRGNDLTWGRHDAAEIILKHLWPQHGDPAVLEGLIKQAHADIEQEMRGLGMDIFTDEHKRDRAHLIGRQTLKDIPWHNKSSWGLRATITTLTMLRDTLQESNLAPFLKGALQVFTWVIWICVGAYHLLQKRWLQFLLSLLGLGGLLYLLARCSG